MSKIVIDSVSATDSTIECRIRPSSDLERFFTGDPFRTSYDVSLEGVPEGILSIPVLAHVCPVAWARGADVYVEAVDATFAQALDDVKSALLSMYDFLEGGTLYAKRTPDLDPRTDADQAESESGLLFTGGVDSTASYIRHRDEDPTLISVRGWTITPDASDDHKWEQLRSRITQFADDRDLETAFIESNMLSALDHPMLLAHYKRHVDGAWYSSVGHGVGLLGLCAPMAYARGMDDLYVAATHWEGIDLEWGSHPDIDDHVRWAGTECHHDCYDITRQERLDLIAQHERTRGSETPDLELQTCNARMDGNCGTCEKCYRTAIGLRLSGLEPMEYGYPFEDENYHDVRSGFERDEWELGLDERYMWEDIQQRVRETEPRSPAEAAFFEWLDETDLEAVVSDSASPLHHRLLRAGARNAPNRVYNTLYPLWDTAKAGARRVR